MDRVALCTNPESGAVGNPYGKIGEDCTEPIRKGRSESQVMGDLVDRQEEILVCRCTNDIGHQDIF